MVKLILDLDKIREIDPEFDLLLTNLKKPSLSRKLLYIFSDTGIIVQPHQNSRKYRIRAIPYFSAFLIHVSDIPPPYQPHGVWITFSVKEILDKIWWKNKKIPNRIKKVLDKIYDQFVDLEDFKLVLERKKREELEKKMRGFISFSKQRGKFVRHVLCPIDGSLRKHSYCVDICPYYLKTQTISVLCRRPPIIVKK